MLKRLFVKNINAEMDGLSNLLFRPLKETRLNPEFPSDVDLDFSLASLHLVEKYLESAKKMFSDHENRTRIVLRAGAYLGQVIRRNSKVAYDWYDFQQAIKLSKDIQQFGECLETRAVLISKENAVLFPLNKVVKFAENGSADSIHYFASVATQGAIEG
jgi:hypothetical protein